MKELLRSALAGLGYRVQGTRYIPRQLLQSGLLRTIEFDDVVCRRMFESGQEFHFIQVGALDGITVDPLRKYIDRCGWRGVLVEPQAHAAGALRELYRDNDRIVIVSAAVDRKSGSRKLFTVESEDAPTWVAGLASFERNTILKHSDLVPGLGGMIRETTVPCVTFDDILRHLPSEHIDLLQIDTEGADAFILSLFPFDRIQPSIVHWEVKHLSTSEREDCLHWLSRFGYQFAACGGEDMMAVRATGSHV
jgi:FkbM family methyltransferase